MALINRVTRLFKADFHAVLDRIEEPEQVLRQAVREMDEELANEEQRIQALTQEQEGLRQRKQELDRKASEIDEELDLCFAKQKDDLARSLVRRKLEAGRLARRLASRLEAVDQSLTDARARFDENRVVLDGLKQKADVFARSPQPGAAVDSEDVGWMARDLVVGDDEVEVAFMREQQARASS